MYMYVQLYFISTSLRCTMYTLLKLSNLVLIPVQCQLHFLSSHQLAFSPPYLKLHSIQADINFSLTISVTVMLLTHSCLQSTVIFWVKYKFLKVKVLLYCQNPHYHHRVSECLIQFPPQCSLQESNNCPIPYYYHSHCLYALFAVEGQGRTTFPLLRLVIVNARI